MENIMFYTTEDLNKKFAEHLNLPIPNSVGKGNEIRGVVVVQ